MHGYVQVCVIQGGGVLADMAAGTMGLVDPRPVTPTTLFPLLAVSRIVTAALINALVEQNQLGTNRGENGGNVLLALRSASGHESA